MTSLPKPLPKSAVKRKKDTLPLSTTFSPTSAGRQDEVGTSVPAHRTLRIVGGGPKAWISRRNVFGSTTVESNPCVPFIR